MQFRKPTPSERAFLFSLPSVGLYVILLSYMQNERALLAAAVAFIFATTLDFEWHRRRSTRFWLGFAGLALLHLLAVALMPLPVYHGPSLPVVLLFMVLDGFFVWFTIARFARGSQ